MILTVIGWIGLFTLCQCKVILVSNEGNNSVDCCVRGREKCLCSSFVDALNHLESDTLINITVQSVTLHNHTTVEYLDNVTILGNGATVMCNHTGSMDCRFCSNIKMEGITWDQCADSEFIVGLSFLFASNITISMCTFQYSNACASVIMLMRSGSIVVQRCQFLFNHVGNTSDCTVYAGLLITNDDRARSLTVIITETLFHHNGIFGLSSDELYRTLSIKLFELLETTVYIDVVTVSANSGLGGYFVFHNTFISRALLNNIVFTNNRRGGAEVRIFNTIPMTDNRLAILFSTFAYNINGSLKLTVQNLYSFTAVLLNSSTIKGNVGTFGKDPSIDSDSYNQGTGILLWLDSQYTYVELSFCNISNNDGGDSSIVYLKDHLGNDPLIDDHNEIVINSLRFTNNYGSALYLSQCNVTFQGYSSFTNNLAQSGAAIYFAQNSQATIGENSTLEFVNNVASLFGGAIYIIVPSKCIYQGVTFTNLPNTSVVSFVNNSAEIAGDSLYFSIPESCSVVGNSSDNNSLVYIPYHFTYKQLPGSVVPEISTSPYAVNLCSTECSISNVNDCFIGNGKMLGQSIYFNATVCDYYNNVSEPVQFLMECVNCNGEYRLSDSKILLHSGLSKFAVSAIDANRDISTNKNITIELTSVNSYEYKQLSVIISTTLSPCHGGYIFDINLQQCKCYDQDVIQCQQDYAEIKYGYWFGSISSALRTSSLCPTYYCDFDKRIENRAGYYNLPNKENDQCNLHRMGMACGECTAGHTLAYDSTDCIDANNCTPGMTILLIFLTILYWIAIVAVIFGLMYLNINISLGYLYGVLFYYSIVDILLGSKLYISVGVFQLTTILSSFAKLAPQFLGKLCFVQGLSGIDQQFIHYAHALAVFLLTIVIVIAARWSMKIASIVSHCIIRVICLLLLLAYTSLASTSLQLLRPLYYHDTDDVYVYLSPSIEYFGGRHAAYGIIACGCGLIIVIGFPLLLFLQPFLRGKVNFIKIKPLLDQFQGCYKNQYHWFAAYYLVCRLLIIGIAFESNFNNGLYYLQTIGIIIVMIHIWIQPYQSDTLNILDGIILLTMILTINLGSYTFIRSTTTILVIAMVIFPLGLSLTIFAYFSSTKFFANQKNRERCSELHDVALRYVCYNKIFLSLVVHRLNC